MPDEFKEFEKRKQDHIALALNPNNQTTDLNKLDTVKLLHEALPDFNFNEIDFSTKRLNKLVKNPFLISSMTAGHTDAQTINNNLMQAAEETGWAMGVGSQRRELFDKDASKEWKSIRTNYSSVSLFGNLGIAQLITANIDDILRLTDVLHADGLIIHCNPMQECIQPEGTPFFKGCWQALEKIIAQSSIPIIIKETGCGFSESTIIRLANIGVAAIDVSGLGGTHWGRIEGERAQDNSIKKRASITFKNWGIDTVSSLKYTHEVKNKIEVWGSGGVRNGLDAAKLIALGAQTIGFAKPLLQASLTSSEDVITEMRAIEYELQVAMFCTGSKVLPDLKEKLCL